MQQSSINLVMSSFLLGLLSKSVLPAPASDATILCRGTPCNNEGSPTSDLSSTVFTPQLAKRTQHPAAPPTPPGTNNYQDLFSELEQAGWEWQFYEDHRFLPAYTSSQSLVRLFSDCMAFVAAKMLADVGQPQAFHAQLGEALKLSIMAGQQCIDTDSTTMILTWQLLYYLLLYLRNHAARGFSGTGALYLYNRQDPRNLVVVRMVLELEDEMGQVAQNPCGRDASC
ncbi:MAG: hypothetical protein Q9201_005632 [Fulgogasparrea decipioides]